MITADADFVIEEGGALPFSHGRSAIFCEPRIERVSMDTHVDVQIHKTAASGGQVSGLNMVFTDAELDAYSSSGADETAKYYNQVEQAVADALARITENSGIAFTIS